MTRRWIRPAVASIAMAGVLAACGGSSDTEATIPEITLVTTTTTTTTTAVPSTVTETVPEAPAQTVADSVSESTIASPTSVDPAASTTVVPLPDPSGDFTLQADGLGSTAFGADPDATISFVTSFLGPATADTGWVDPFTIGACSGTQLRQVSWQNLQLEFGDSSNITDGRPHFYAYTYGAEGEAVASPAGLETEDGLTIGSTVAQLLQLYPSVELLQADEFIADNFLINDSLTGRLSGLRDTDVIEVIIGGLRCES